MTTQWIQIGGVTDEGAGLNRDQVDQRISPWARATPVGMAPVSVLPPEVLLESELTAARVRTILGLTEQELQDFFVNATISGNTITITQADDTEITLNLPVVAGGMADGVVQTARLNGTVLVLGLTQGSDVTIDLAPLQDGAGITEARVNMLIQTATANFLNQQQALDLMAPWARGGTNRSGLVPENLIDPDIARDTEIAAAMQMVLSTIRGAAPTNLNTLERIAASIGNDTMLNTVLRGLIALRAPLASPTFSGTVIVPAPGDSPQDGQAVNVGYLNNRIPATATGGIRIGWSNSNVSISGNDLTVVSDTTSAVIPDRATNGYLLLWTPNNLGTVTEVHIGGSTFNELGTFTDGAPITILGTIGTLRVSRMQRNGPLLSQETLRVVYN